jgi:hypothetical protein
MTSASDGKIGDGVSAYQKAMSQIDGVARDRFLFVSGSKSVDEALRCE